MVNPIPEVSINPRRRAGEPCITGTRIPVAMVASLVNDGYPPRKVKYWYHGVTADTARKVTEWHNQQGDTQWTAATTGQSPSPPSSSSSAPSSGSSPNSSEVVVALV